jgi:hypothetical protein
MHRFQKWRDAMQAAPDAESVTRIMGEYVTTIPETVRSLLPAEAQQALKDPDLLAAAVTILHCELAFRGDPAVADMLHEVAHTYAAASLRITRLTKESAPGA